MSALQIVVFALFCGLFGGIILTVALCDQAWKVGMTIGGMLLAIAVIIMMSAAFARDPGGKYAAANPELHEWFESLRSGRGPCCADADGMSLSDVEWESKNGHYRVLIPSNGMAPRSSEPVWVDVPDDAVINEPNKSGRTIVWPMYRDGNPSVRCFIPGPMT